MKIITLDFETYWDSKTYTLSKMGPIEYIRDPRFKAQLLGVRIDRNPVEVFEGEAISRGLQALELHKPDRMVVGHNLNGFDALILSEIYGIRPRWMFDTMAMMRWTGISRISGESHAALTQHLGTGHKRAGTLISDGKRWPHDFTYQDQINFKAYCSEDVMQCSENFFKMVEFCTADAARFASITARMATEPALYFDKEMLEQYLRELDQRTEQAWLDLSRIFRLNSTAEMMGAIRSPTIFPQMLRQLGVEPPVKFSKAKTETAKAKNEATWAAWSNSPPGSFRHDQVDPHMQQVHAELTDPDFAVYTPALSKTDLEFLDLQEHPDERVALLVRTRLEQNSSILRSRTERFIALAKDNKPVPVMLQVFKAHTSRYTAGNEGQSDGTQFQNLNKRDKNQLTLRRAIKAPSGCKLVSGDSSQIEARMLACIACQDDLVEQFRRKECPYSILATRIFETHFSWQQIKAGDKSGDLECTKMRHVGKTGILSAGYQVGPKKFSDTLLRAGVKLHEDLDKHFELAKHAHAVYRLSNPMIVKFWGRCQEVIEHMYQGGQGKFGGPNDDIFTYGMMSVPGTKELCPSIKMPSGFILRYPNLRPEQSEKGRVEYYYDRRRGRSIVPTKIYGGSLTENLIQGLSFQLLQWQACRMEEAGIELKCNIHDAYQTVVPEAEVEKTAGLMEHWMSQTPPWLPNFPVACEVKIGDDFTIA